MRTKNTYIQFTADECVTDKYRSVTDKYICITDPAICVYKAGKDVTDAVIYICVYKAGKYG